MGKESTGRVIDLTQRLFERLGGVQRGSAEFFVIREKIVELNLKLIYYMCNKYLNSKTRYLYDDMISAGELGLVKAVNNFDPSKGNIFGTFAGACIENEILMLLRREKKYENCASFETPVFRESETFTLEDTLAEQEDSIEKVYDNIELDEQRGMLAKALKTLSPKQLTIIKLYALREEKMTQREIAEKLKLSQSYVSRLLKQSIQTLRLYVQKQEEKPAIVITRYEPVKNTTEDESE